MAANNFKTQNELLKLDFFGPIFKITFWSIVIAEAWSFFGYFSTWINKAGFIAAIILVLILGWKKLEWGLYVVLTELFIASKGYLFYWSIGDKAISVRLVIFFTLLLLWFIKAVKAKDLSLKQTKFFWPFIILFMAIIGGIVLGYLQNNKISNIFFDVNGYLYFGLVFAVFMVIKSWQQVKEIMQIFFASLLAMGLETILLLYFFSHRIGNLTYIYRWVRLTGVGEITLMSNNFYRIFFQSHIYYLFSLVILAVILIKFIKQLSKKDFYFFSSLWLLSLFILIVGYSRSFWLAGVVALILLLLWLILFERMKLKSLSKIIAIFLGSSLISLGLIWLIINFPLPNPHRTVSFSSLIEERTEIKGEAAAGSRFNLLSPLLKKIKQSPIIGSGFGATVTYQTKDARALAANPNGLYTTFAFEWGYLDILTKIGLIGLGVYLFLLFKIFWLGFKSTIASCQLPVASYKFFDFLKLGLIISFLTLLVVHATTPYLNHPLGIGWILLCAAILNLKEYEKS